jgi:tetratricopeptide (TPR) repeat protein
MKKYFMLLLIATQYQFTYLVAQQDTVLYDQNAGNYIFQYLRYNEDTDERDSLVNIIFVPATKIDPSITARIEYINDSGKYLFKYSIYNGLNSIQKVKSVLIEFGENIEIIDKSIHKWFGIRYTDGENPINKYSWLGNQGLEPTWSKGGFILSSEGLPGIGGAYFQGKTGFPSFPPGMSYELDSIYGELDKFPTNYVMRQTVVPVAIPTPFYNTNFTDTLTSYTSRSRSYGWITTQPIADKYAGYFTTAKTQLNSGNNSGAWQTLKFVLRDADIDSASALSSEAYALIRYNTEYLLSKIPVWKPENIQGSFAPTPQSVTITWTPEYSPTMLLNGGGYDIYRAIYYDGIALSFTKLNTSLITTGTYTDNPGIPGSIPVNKDVYLRYYLKAKNNQNIVSESSDTLSVFAGTTRSGALTANTTWSANTIVVGNITVNAGVTLTISPNVTVRFASSTGITSNGVINAVGTSSQMITFTSLSAKSYGSWGSIMFSGNGAHGSAIRYAVMKYGNEISAYNVTGAGGGVEVTNCVIDTTINAVRFNNAAGNANDNTINYPRDHGIIFDNSANGNCFRNVITKSNKSGAAIIYSGGALGYAWKNKVNGFNWGMASYWGAMPMFGFTENQGINNNVTNCLYGLKIYNWSYPEIGLPSSLDSGRTYGNNYYGNTTNAHIYTTPDDTVFAQNIYWGTGTPSTKITVGSSVMKFDFSNHLAEHTWPTGQISGQKKPAQFRTLATTPPTQKEQRAKIDAEKSIYEGMKLRLQGKITEAREYFASMVQADPGNIRAYLELYKSQTPASLAEIEQIFTSNALKTPPFVKMLQGQLFLRSGKIQQAKEINNALIQQHPNTVISARAMVNNFYILLYSENNLKAAQLLLKEITQKPELTTEIELSLAQQALESYVMQTSQRFER